MKPLLATLTALFACATSAVAQPVADHLKCFKVKDAQPKAAYVADLSGLAAEAGCTIKVPATLVCVPTTKTNVQPAPSGGGGTGTPNTFGCYKLKCPKGTVPPTLTLTDQFGSRVVTPSKSKLVCAPAAEATTTTVTTSTTTTTTPCTQAFEPRLQDAIALFTLNLDPSGNFEAPTSCGGSPAVCCPGGTPTTPCGPLNLELSSAAVAAPALTDRLDLTFRARLTTVADIPVNVPLVGDCLLHIDTAPGPTDSIQIQYSLHLSPDHLRVVTAGDVVITELTTDDVTLGGPFGCQLANLGLSFFIDTLTDTVADFVAPQEQLCRLCDGTIGACPP